MRQVHLEKGYAGNPLLNARDEIVGDDDDIASFSKKPNDMGSDISCAAGYKYTHILSVPDGGPVFGLSVAILQVLLL